jgi:hypothetical protein
MATQPRPSLRDSCVLVLAKGLHVVPLATFTAHVLSEDVLLALLAVRAAASCVPGVSCWRQD